MCMLESEGRKEWIRRKQAFVMNKTILQTGTRRWSEKTLFKSKRRHRRHRLWLFVGFTRKRKAVRNWLLTLKRRSPNPRMQKPSLALVEFMGLYAHHSVVICFGSSYGTELICEGFFLHPNEIQDFCSCPFDWCISPPSIKLVKPMELRYGRFQSYMAN